MRGGFDSHMPHQQLHKSFLVPITDMKHFEFHLSISPEKYLAYYRGTVKNVVVRCGDGPTIQFPASLLQQHVMPDGINGYFVLMCDDTNKGATLQRKGLR